MRAAGRELLAELQRGGTGGRARIYADKCYVFKSGSLNELAYITANGRFKLTRVRYGNPVGQRFGSTGWLCEIALCAKTVHGSTLRASTVADAFTLSNDDLMFCVR